MRISGICVRGNSSINIFVFSHSCLTCFVHPASSCEELCAVYLLCYDISGFTGYEPCARNSRFRPSNLRMKTNTCIPPGMQRFGNQRWRQDSEWRHVQERILIPCCICSWYARDLQISTQITLPRPKSHDSSSQIKAHYSDRVLGRWKDQCWFNNHRIFSSYVQHVV